MWLSPNTSRKHHNFPRGLCSPSHLILLFLPLPFQLQVQKMVLSTTTGFAIVIMGVSGSGKSTVAKSLANAIGCKFIEADDFHPPSNKEKMKSGVPLSDSDRFPWLELLRSTIKENIEHGHNITLSCSALLKKYREILRSADCDYKPGNYTQCKVKFLCLEAPVEVLMERMKRRSEQGSISCLPACYNPNWICYSLNRMKR
ncbi:hypothetical protein LUZ61_020071 [Rhynchospora tenuis]|uniref:Gluconokinase n=1 Tax=Rhynchospora tenuis TaxID=198213 RepID=A0AAD5ZCB0_9POAL|nr:hypothetical protein LUZ61_020071 [Rhynchospora tenuis]